MGMSGTSVLISDMPAQPRGALSILQPKISDLNTEVLGKNWGRPHANQSVSKGSAGQTSTKMTEEI